MSWGTAEGEAKSLGWGIIHNEVVLSVDSLRLACLTQVIIRTDSALVPPSNHFSFAAITDNSWMLLGRDISTWIAICGLGSYESEHVYVYLQYGTYYIHEETFFLLYYFSIFNTYQLFEVKLE